METRLKKSTLHWPQMTAPVVDDARVADDEKILVRGGLGVLVSVVVSVSAFV